MGIKRSIELTAAVLLLAGIGAAFVPFDHHTVVAVLLGFYAWAGLLVSAFITETPVGGRPRQVTTHRGASSYPPSGRCR